MKFNNLTFGPFRPFLTQKPQDVSLKNSFKSILKLYTAAISRKKSEKLFAPIFHKTWKTYFWALWAQKPQNKIFFIFGSMSHIKIDDTFHSKISKCSFREELPTNRKTEKLTKRTKTDKLTNERGVFHWTYTL